MQFETLNKTIEGLTPIKSKKKLKIGKNATLTKKKVTCLTNQDGLVIEEIVDEKVNIVKPKKTNRTQSQKFKNTNKGKVA